jgi:hypothetical protein
MLHSIMWAVLKSVKQINKNFLFFFCNHWFFISYTDDCQSRVGTRKQQWQWKEKFCNLCFKYGTQKHDCIPVACLPVQAHLHTSKYILYFKRRGWGPSKNTNVLVCIYCRLWLHVSALLGHLQVVMSYTKAKKISIVCSRGLYDYQRDSVVYPITAVF